MRPKISNINIQYYLKQTYNYSSINSFFESSEGFDKHRAKVITELVKVFTGYKFENNKLVCYNPYTAKNEVLKIKNFHHVQSKEELLKELSMLHKTRMYMLEQSRKRILKLSKEKTLARDQDLKSTISKTKSKRLQQLEREHDIDDRQLEQEL